jgi:hypothetical protein
MHVNGRVALFHHRLSHVRVGGSRRAFSEERVKLSIYSRGSPLMISGSLAVIQFIYMSLLLRENLFTTLRDHAITSTRSHRMLTGALKTRFLDMSKNLTAAVQLVVTSEKAKALTPAHLLFGRFPSSLRAAALASHPEPNEP